MVKAQQDAFASMISAANTTARTSTSAIAATVSSPLRVTHHGVDARPDRARPTITGKQNQTGPVGCPAVIGSRPVVGIPVGSTSVRAFQTTPATTSRTMVPAPISRRFPPCPRRFGVAPGPR